MTDSLHFPFCKTDRHGCGGFYFDPAQVWVEYDPEVPSTTDAGGVRLICLLRGADVERRSSVAFLGLDGHPVF